MVYCKVQYWKSPLSINVRVKELWFTKRIVFSGSVNTLYEDSLGYIDFHPSSNVGVVYAAEADMAMQAGLRKRLAKLRKV